MKRSIQLLSLTATIFAFQTKNASAQTIAIAAGEEHSLFLCNTKTAMSCGYNVQGQLGIGSSNGIPNPVPAQVNALSDIIAISAGALHSLFLKADGTAWACGNNGSGELGDGTATNRSTPVQVTGGIP